MTPSFRGRKFTPERRLKLGILQSCRANTTVTQHLHSRCFSSTFWIIIRLTAFLHSSYVSEDVHVQCQRQKFLKQRSPFIFLHPAEALARAEWLETVRLLPFPSEKLRSFCAKPKLPILVRSSCFIVPSPN